MAIGQMIESSNPYVPQTISDELKEIKSVDELVNLENGQEFYYVSLGEGLRPRIKGPFTFYGLKCQVSPHFPNDGIKDYLISIEYVDLPYQSNRIKRWKWMDVKYIFTQKYHAIFTSKRKASEYMKHVDHCYDTDKEWFKWLAQYKSESELNRSRFHDFRRMVESPETD